MQYSIEQTEEFSKWLSTLSSKNEALVRSRLTKIRDEGYFGNYRVLGDGLIELKWKNGLRVYFIKTGLSKVRILFGGDKNGQKKDIEKARRMF